jgi:hypothetical protein
MFLVNSQVRCKVAGPWPHLESLRDLGDSNKLDNQRQPMHTWTED